ncbi:MAG: hypothetical protein LBQ28_05355 [Prevotellaceae bacterium]|nr:hypothetical protein [Prevotellaceae bacterium]
MKTKIENINLLIEKYLEGFTSLKEEQRLRNYFQRKNIPEHLQIYKPVFMFLSAEIKRKHPAKYLIINWKNKGIAAVAACLVLFFGLKLFSDNHTISETSIAYINGKKYSEMKFIYAETLESLNNISIGNTDVYATQIDALEQFFENN